MSDLPETKKCVPIPAGALFTVSSGEYSDYSIAGIFRAKVDIDADALLADYLASHPDQKQRYRFNQHMFIVSVADKMESIDSWEFHVSDYSSAGEHWVSHYGGNQS